ncbi:MAG: DUF2141 domain-containing protein [Prevotella sp.]|jgi:uncharacterized protein (DUF2141 family)|nr:DUF2141 domain-containing protein [Prevotella sp.]MCH4240440.1 DUF2141 domain-containing protein [Prevotella sp.]
MKKRLLMIVIAFTCMTFANARNVVVKLQGVRDQKGKIMLMAERKVKDPQKTKSKPILMMCDAVKGEVDVTLTNVVDGEYLISVFHDENGNRQMDTDEQGRPLEGYARKAVVLDSKTSEVKMKMYYPLF